MKRFAIILSIIVLCLCVNANKVFAEKYKPTVVYSDEVVDIKEGSYLVPIKIKNNTGIMGFKITVFYGDGVTINSISRGSVTAKGNLIDNHLKFADEKYFDVIWNHTKEITGNGELFIIGLTMDSDYDGDVILDIEYSSPDTFDEQYGNVILDCKDVILKESVKENHTENISGKSETADNTTGNESKQSGNGLIVNAKPINKYNNNKFIKKAETENTVGIAYNRLSGEDFQNAIEEALKNQGLSDIDNIPKDKQRAFLENVLKTLDVDDTDTILENDENGELFDHIRTTYMEQKNELGNNETNSGKTSNNKIYFILICILIVGIISVVFVLKKRKDKKHEEI